MGLPFGKYVAKFHEPEDPPASAYIQYLIDYLDGEGLLEEGCFTFPDGTTWWATGKG